MDKNEELLIKRAQRGNLQAFEQLVHRYDAKVMRITYNMVNNVEDARDIYQEVFIKVFQSIEKFRFQSEFNTWLFRIAINTCLTFRKQKATKQHYSLDEFDADDNKNWRVIQDNDIGNPEQQLLNKEFSKQIENSLDQLSPKQRVVFVLKHYHGYKLREIATIMRCSEGTIKNYLFRATQKLKQTLHMYQQL